MSASTYLYPTKALEAFHPDGWANVEPETGDPYAHVVLHKGQLYVHDGHHRYVIALTRARRTLLARVVQVES